MKLILVRHGQSVWNLENRFTGWTDVDLSNKGIEEAKEVGLKLKEEGYTFDIAYTSVLIRAINTLKYILEVTNINVPVIKSYKLNERHYGALQGLNKDETRKKYGDDQVKLWRRSADVRPPALEKDDKRYPGNDIKYKDLKEEELPLSENLNDTIKRVVEFYHSDIEVSLRENKDVIVVAHGNSLRGLVKYLENMSDQEVIDLEIPTGCAYIYELDDNLNIVSKKII